jgi:septum formation protein
MRIVLASTSRFRRALLDRIGLVHDAVAPDFDEDHPPPLAPPEIARAFAIGKAVSVVVNGEALVIGADQVLEHRGELLRKPGTLDEAAAQLERLAGDAHFLHTAVAVRDAASGRVESELVTVRLVVRRLDRDAIRRYVERDRPVGCVGGYTFEGLGACLFESVGGGDDSAIVGLPLLALTRLLLGFGVDPLDRDV